ncbi:hypothetical protein ACIRJR_19905 [Streptomyces sp. NPDC102402]
MAPYSPPSSRGIARPVVDGSRWTIRSGAQAAVHALGGIRKAVAK